jgi:hypothetical protein
MGEGKGEGDFFSILFLVPCFAEKSQRAADLYRMKYDEVPSPAREIVESRSLRRDEIPFPKIFLMKKRETAMK